MADGRRVLLTVSGEIPATLDDDVAAGRRPRADYRAIADVCGADVIDVPGALTAGGRGAAFIHRWFGVGAVLAWYCFRHRRRYDVILTDGEQVGIPLAMLTRFAGRSRARHVMIVHILSVPKKARLITAFRIASQVDRYVVYCRAQADFVHGNLRVPREHIVLSTFMVDTAFFSPRVNEDSGHKTVCSAGLERRDYPTLMEAVEGADVGVVIAAASPWSKQADSSATRPLPANVTIERLSLFELRQLYVRSAFVVMPLLEVDFQAGITTILEAMAMGRAVVCTRTSGQTDTIVDGHTGIYVAPHDPAALRHAITELLANPDEQHRLGENGRRWVVDHADIDVYARRIAGVVENVATEASGHRN